MTRFDRRTGWARAGGAFLLPLALSACAAPEGDSTNGDGAAANPDPPQAATEAAVDSALQSFVAAQRAIDGDRAAAHMWPEFTMLQDGRQATHEEVVEQIRGTFPAIEAFTTEWTNVQLRVLSPTLALTSFHFRDSIVMTTGELIRSQGPTTLVWERRGPDWRILYGDVDHYPVEPTPP